MEHSFDIEIATRFGLIEAILLNNIWWWVEKNRANESNYYDGNYWTFNSTKAFAELFPYVSQKQIQNALKRLISEGILITGNYNKSVYDRTLWYAFTEKGKCIVQKGKMEDTKRENGLCKNVKPIPDINTDNLNTDNKQNNRPPKKQLEDEFESLWSIYPKKQGKSKALEYYIAARNAKEPTTFEEVENGINAYNFNIKENKIDPQFIKHGSTWFKQQCWKDDYTVYKKQEDEKEERVF